MRINLSQMDNSYSQWSVKHGIESSNRNNYQAVYHSSKPDFSCQPEQLPTYNRSYEQPNYESRSLKERHIPVSKCNLSCSKQNNVLNNNRDKYAKNITQTAY